MANANIKAVITAEDKASKVVSQFGQHVQSMNDRLVASAKVAGAAMAAAGTAAATFALKSAANFEQTRIGLENMLGSADNARRLLKDISDFAAKTPFEFPELAQATRQLVAFGFSADEAFDTMKQLGNVSAAIGAPIEDLAYLMGTLRTQGRAFTIDIRQFAMRGIPIYEELGKVLKVNGETLTKMIEEGKVGFKEVQKAFDNLAGAGGRWGNTMERQSRSVNGLFSTLKDTIGITARELVGITQEGDIKEGSAFARLRDAVDYLNRNLPELIARMKEIVRSILPQLRQWAENVIQAANAIANYLQPKLLALWNTIKEAMPTFERLWKEVIVPLTIALGQTLVAAIGLLIDALNLLITVMTPVFKVMLDNKPTVIALAATFGVLALAMNFSNIAAAFSAAMTVVTGSLAAVQGGVAALNVGLAAFGGFAAFAALAGVAIAAVLKFRDEIGKLNSVLDHANESIAKRDINAYLKTYEDIKKRDPEAARRFMMSQTRAAGGPIVGGQPYLVGEQGPEIVVPKGSGTVIPNDKSQQLMGGGTVNISVNVGMYAGTEMEKRRMAETLFNALKDVAQAKNMTLPQMMGQ